VVETEAREDDICFPMDQSRTITLSWVFGAPGDISYQLARFRFAKPVPTWQPAVNAYRAEDSIRICVDLAGVERATIDLRLEPKRITIRGTRDVPKPADVKERDLQMLIMEIDYGPFERTIGLREEIDVKKAHAEPQNGLLWIYLPLKS
jgi:HSP20 family molecular chaperone IbpA